MKRNILNINKNKWSFKIDFFCSGNNTNISGFTLNDLIPNTTEYMTYEGSLTIPGCQESVTWIIFNKPIYLSADQV